MNKTLVGNIFIFISSIVIDQFAKNCFRKLGSFQYNEGIIFGLYSDVSSGLRIITLSSFAGFLFFFYILLIYLLSRSLSRLKFGISLFMGGVFGNVIDRLILGKAIDFIPLKLIFNSELMFNIADVFLWVGFLCILVEVFRKDSELWHRDNQRGSIFIHSFEQLKFSMKLTLVVLSCSFIFGFFSFTYLKVLLDDYGINGGNILLIYFISYLFISLSFSLVVFITGFWLSHRYVGPVYAFENFIRRLTQKDSEEEFKLREGDSFKELEEIAKQIQLKLKSK